MCFVVKENVEMVVGGDFSFSDRTAIASTVGGLPFAGGVAVFCFEGFAMTLALEGSMRERESFPKLLGKVLAGITFVYVLFGFCGYMAYGDETKDIITLNLPNNWSAIAVQVKTMPFQMFLMLCIDYISRISSLWLSSYALSWLRVLLEQLRILPFGNYSLYFILDDVLGECIYILRNLKVTHKYNSISFI